MAGPRAAPRRIPVKRPAVLALASLVVAVAASGKRAKLVVFDLETLKATREVDTGEGPDAVLYVATTKEVWAFNGKAKTVTCVDAATLEVKATIALEGKPELAVEHAEKGL